MSRYYQFKTCNNEWIYDSEKDVFKSVNRAKVKTVHPGKPTHKALTETMAIQKKGESSLSQDSADQLRKDAAWEHWAKQNEGKPT